MKAIWRKWESWTPVTTGKLMRLSLVASLKARFRDSAGCQAVVTKTCSSSAAPAAQGTILACSFCVRCILEWSKISNTCPLCKQRFWVVYHKRLDMSKLGNTSENVADKFPGEVLVTHKVAERNQVRPLPGKYFTLQAASRVLLAYGICALHVQVSLHEWLTLSDTNRLQ